MNTQHHRVIFNKQRGCMMAVSEVSGARSQLTCAGGAITFGPAPGGSLSLGRSEVNSDFNSVGEQSAIRAGDGGFQVNVQGNTSLSGGQITSTQAAIDAGANSFNGNTAEGLERLTTTDLQNSASYKASSASVGLSAGAAQPGASLSGGLSGIGIGSDKGSASSVSTAGISGLAGNSAARTGEATTAIKPIFDAEKVKNEIQAQVTITQEFNKQAGRAIERYVATQRQALQEQANRAATPEDKASAEQAIRDVNMQERALNILVAGLTGMGGSVVTKEALGAAAEKMRDLMIEDSRKFAGVTDGTTTLGNLTGPSDGIRGDGQKIGGTRVDLDLLCGADNKRCETNDDGSLKLNQQRQVVFKSLGAGDKSLAEFLQTPEGQKASGPTGGIQGAVGTLFGTPYTAGSWQDKLIEAFSGTHDMVGGQLSNLYDAQGNIKRGMSDFERSAYDKWAAAAILPSAPFAAAEPLPPEVWKAVAILLGAGR
jgi:filamentous hemagglutinin